MSGASPTRKPGDVGREPDPQAGGLTAADLRSRRPVPV